MNRLESPLDGLLHLMDRQVLDDEGLLVCKCDDLEMEEREDGTLVVTALLVGALRCGCRVSVAGWASVGGGLAPRRVTGSGPTG